MNSNNRFFALVSCFAIFISCTVPKQAKTMENYTKTSNSGIRHDTSVNSTLLDKLLNNYPQFFDFVLKNKESLNVQIIYTEINRKANGNPEFTNHYYNLNPNRYFYPASTVKLPIVMLALQKLNELKDKGITRNSTMITETSYTGQSAVYNDPTTASGKPTIANYIKKILLVSDNDAYNRLYEFLGQEYINSELHKKGLTDVQILHRLDIFLTETENRHTNPIKFYDDAGKLIYEQAQQNNLVSYAPRNDSLGIGYYSGGKIVNKPMVFSKKNRLPLEDLHGIIKRVVFPEKFKPEQRFNITEEDRQFVLKYMSQYPTENQFPDYAADTANYWDTYCKFIFYGADKVAPEKHIRIFNKPGDAYGHLIDGAYIVDYQNKIEFFVSAMIYCNSDGILNDNQYDYKTIGLPFMKNLGRVLYNYELSRTYKHKPDLSSVLFTYDK